MSPVVLSGCQCSSLWQPTEPLIFSRLLPLRCCGLGSQATKPENNLKEERERTCLRLQDLSRTPPPSLLHWGVRLASKSDDFTSLGFLPAFFFFSHTGISSEKILVHVIYLGTCFSKDPEWRPSQKSALSYAPPMVYKSPSSPALLPTHWPHLQIEPPVSRWTLLQLPRQPSGACCWQGHHWDCLNGWWQNSTQTVLNTKELSFTHMLERPESSAFRLGLIQEFKRYHQRQCLPSLPPCCWLDSEAVLSPLGEAKMASGTLALTPFKRRKGVYFIEALAVTSSGLIGWTRLLEQLLTNHSGQETDSLEKTLMLGKVEGKQRRRWHWMRWLDSSTDSMDMNLSRLQEIVKNREA